MPSISLILSICHPEMLRFKSAATADGCEHEKKGRYHYMKESLPNHQEFKVIQKWIFYIFCQTFYWCFSGWLGVCEIKVCRSSSFEDKICKIG